MSLKSLVATGTKLWLDSVDPEAIRRDSERGVTGATSNPAIIADLVKGGRLDRLLQQFFDRDMDDAEVAWAITDHLVLEAQKVFRPVWDRTRGNDGYVSFELDPLLEDPELGPPHGERVRRYVDLGRRWGHGRFNRMIKVPATPAGLEALEELTAGGITVNVTLCFTERQYTAARDAIWRGAQRRERLDSFKSVYSIFVSRVDVYTKKQLPTLSPQAQGQVGIANAKRMYRLNREFFADKRLPLEQEIVFASTGVKTEGDPPDKYVDALAGGGIMTNPPATNEAVERLDKTYGQRVDQMPPPQVLDEIAAKVDVSKMERALMEEGVAKFADPHKALLRIIAEKRESAKEL